MGEGEPDILVAVGELLFGARWQRDLARALDTSDRMVRYWVSGSHARPGDLEHRLLVLLLDRVERIEQMAGRLGTASERGKQK